MHVTEIFGSNVDWFSSTKSATEADAGVGSSTWSNIETSGSAVSNGHLDVWPTLATSGTIYKY